MTYATLNITSVTDFFAYPNTVTDNWFWTIMLMVFWMVIFVTVYNSEDDTAKTKATSKAFMAASLPVGTLSIFMLVTTPPLVNPFVAGVGCIMIILSLLFVQVD
jgi:membrane-associated HD superfamily phosphohydrolase